MVSIRNFDKDDIHVLKENMFQNAETENIIAAIDQWNGYRFEGKYFEMFAICVDERVVGTVSLVQHSDYVISAWTEIFSPFRKKGYAGEGQALALDHAKKLGYKIAIAKVKKENAASIKLHEKLGYLRDDYELKNKNGEEVYIYLKLL